MLFPNRVGELRRLRAVRLTQKALAVAIGISSRQLRSIEAGVTVPSAIRLAELAVALRVCVSDLYDPDWLESLRVRDPATCRRRP